MVNSAGRTVTVNSLKYDNSIRRTWSAQIKQETEDRLVLEGSFETDVEHHDLGLISAGTISVETYWFTRWYSIFRFLTPDGGLRNYYCNVNMPPVFSGSTLSYIDLDLDVVVWPNGRHSILDAAEFEENARLFSYPEEVRNGASTALEELIELIENGGLPN